jgi:hypothetical protein
MSRGVARIPTAKAVKKGGGHLSFLSRLKTSAVGYTEGSFLSASATYGSGVRAHQTVSTRAYARFNSRAFIGLPCPKNAVGMDGALCIIDVTCCRSFRTLPIAYYLMLEQRLTASPLSISGHTDQRARLVHLPRELDWLTAHLAVFDVPKRSHRQIHGGPKLLPAIRALDRDELSEL